MTSVILARIILSEKYSVNPKFIAMNPDLAVMLSKASKFKRSEIKDGKAIEF